MKDITLRRVGLALAAPALAVAVAIAVSSIVLIISGSNPIDAYHDMFFNALKLETSIDILNRATPFYISGVAAAIGFRMNLFNIGVEGQYLLAAFFASVVGGAVNLPPVLHVALVLIVAMSVGAAWSGLAGVLKVTRGVNEVISTIMLNFIATGGIIAGLIVVWQDNTGQVNSGTTPIPESGRMPDLNSWVEIFTRDIGKGRRLTGVLLIAIVVGIAYHLFINRSTIGFEFRASGYNPFAARAGGIAPKKMVLTAMVLSGAIAGLVGMVEVLSDNYRYDQSFIRGLGFQGIAVALLGRNKPVGIAVAALLFGFLDASAGALQISGSASREIVVIMQATILLAAVVAYEVVNRLRQKEEAKTAAALLAGSAS